jgi:hypothetical protein
MEGGMHSIDIHAHITLQCFWQATEGKPNTIGYLADRAVTFASKEGAAASGRYSDRLTA